LVDHQEPMVGSADEASGCRRTLALLRRQEPIQGRRHGGLIVGDQDDIVLGSCKYLEAAHIIAADTVDLFMGKHRLIGYTGKTEQSKYCGPILRISGDEQVRLVVFQQAEYTDPQLLVNL